MHNDDINIDLLANLDYDSMINLCSSNSYYAQLCQSNTLWYKRIKQLYPQFNTMRPMDYKWLYYKMITGDQQAVMDYAREHKYPELFIFAKMMIQDSLMEHSYVQRTIGKERQIINEFLAYEKKYLNAIFRFSGKHPNRDRIQQMILRYTLKFKWYDMNISTYGITKLRQTIVQLKDDIEKMEHEFAIAFGEDYYYEVILPQIDA